MSDNPLQSVLQNLQKLATGTRTKFCWMLDQAIHPSPANRSPLLHLSSADSSPLNHNNGGPAFPQPHGVTLKGKTAQPVSKEELGRATWTLLHTLGAQVLAAGTRTKFCNIRDRAIHPQPANRDPLLHLSSADSSPLNHKNGGPALSQPHGITLKDKAAQPVSKEELGRATWTLLHTLGAQYPEKPTMQQRKDVKELMAILSRMYPCSECADHFKEVLRENPVRAGSQAEFSQWLCHVHNVVNRSIDKPIFPCERVDARWGKLDCEQQLCDLQGDKGSFLRRLLGK